MTKPLAPSSRFGALGFSALVLMLGGALLFTGCRDVACPAGTVDVDGICVALEACVDDGATRACGSAVGECSEGTQTCANGLWSLCQGEVGPDAELCDGLDNDCDGEVDEEFPGVGQLCGTDAGECQRGTVTCEDDGLSSFCKGEIGALAEACDGLDNDCDSAVDEGVLASKNFNGFPTGGVIAHSVTATSSGFLHAYGRGDLLANLPDDIFNANELKLRKLTTTTSRTGSLITLAGMYGTSSGVADGDYVYLSFTQTYIFDRGPGEMLRLEIAGSPSQKNRNDFSSYDGGGTAAQEVQVGVASNGKPLIVGYDEAPSNTFDMVVTWLTTAVGTLDSRAFTNVSSRRDFDVETDPDGAPFVAWEEDESVVTVARLTAAPNVEPLSNMVSFDGESPALGYDGAGRLAVAYRTLEGKAALRVLDPDTLDCVDDTGPTCPLVLDDVVDHLGVGYRSDAWLLGATNRETDTVLWVLLNDADGRELFRDNTSLDASSIRVTTNGFTSVVYTANGFATRVTCQ